MSKTRPFVPLVVIGAITLMVSCGSKTEKATKTQASAPIISAAAPTRMPRPAAQQLAVPPGATYVMVKGTVEAHQDAEYVIGAEKGVVFTAHADTPATDLDVVVYRADTGARIADETPRNPNFFMARMPETIGYLVVVRGGDRPSPYRLEIEVPRRLVLDNATPRVEVTNDLQAGAVLAYLTPPGMTVSAQLTEAPPDAYLMAHGLAGKVFLKAADNRRDFTGTPAVATKDSSCASSRAIKTAR